MKKIILLSMLFSFVTHGAGEEGTGNQPQNNAQQNALCSNLLSNGYDSVEAIYQMCLQAQQAQPSDQ